MAAPLPTYPQQTWTDGVSVANATRMGYIEDGIKARQSAQMGIVGFDDPYFKGADDTATMTNVRSYAAAQTYIPAIGFSNRAYGPFTTGLTGFPGERWIGPPGYSNPEKNGGNGTYHGMKLYTTVNGTFYNVTAANSFTISMENICAVGSSSTQFIGNSGSGSYYCLQMRNFYAAGFKSVLGSQATKLLITAGQFDGSWEVNNSYDGAFHVGGSDTVFWPQGMLLDSAAAFVGSGQYHLWFDSMDKSSVGPLYITCEGDWGGVKVSGPTSPNGGSSNAGIVTFAPGLKVEGRNPGQPCYGANVLVQGGQVTLPQAWISYGMSSPSSMGHTPTDKALVDVQGGVAYLEACWYDRATGVAETVPFANVEPNGKLIIGNQLIASRGGTWSGLPRVKNSGGTLVNDSSVTVI